MPPSEIPGGPLSLPLRMEAKRKRSRLGAVAITLGVVLLALGIYGFARGGAELLGLWGVGFGLGATAVGIVLVRKAAAAR